MKVVKWVCDTRYIGSDIITIDIAYPNITSEKNAFNVTAAHIAYGLQYTYIRKGVGDGIIKRIPN